jgi:hypothetical protein
LRASSEANLCGGAAWAQQGERTRRIGVLMNFAPDDPNSQARLTAFLQRLQELGWTDGRNVRIDIRWGVGDALRVGGIVLLPLDVGLYVGRRHKPYRMPKGQQFACPMMRGGTPFHAKLCLQFLAGHWDGRNSLVDKVHIAFNWLGRFSKASVKQSNRRGTIGVVVLPE